MDSFDMDDCLLASQATSDSSTMMVELVFAARVDFADEIKAELELEDIQETNIVVNGFDLSLNIRSDLMDRTKEKDGLSFGSKDVASR